MIDDELKEKVRGLLLNAESLLLMEDADHVIEHIEAAIVALDEQTHMDIRKGGYD
jgi:hypothetical protein